MKESIELQIERKILLNPGPATTTATVKSAMIVPDICPREQEFGDLLRNVRKNTLKVVHAEHSHQAILLGSSGTGAMESCFSTCVDKNEEVLIINNGAYGERMHKICSALGIKHSLLELPWGDKINLESLHNYLEENEGQFKALAFIHHETTVGILNPLREIFEIAKKFNLTTIVDAMSSYAGMEIDLRTTPVDYLISSSNKCIQGMAGIGIVIAKNETLEKIKNYPKKSFYFDLYNNFVNQKEKEQFLFTPPVQTLYALNQAFNEFFLEGEGARYKRYASLYEQMLKGMKEIGFIPLLDEKDNSKILTAFIDPKDSSYDFNQMHDFLYQKGITIYPGKGAKKSTFRISNIGDLHFSDIELFLLEMKNYIQEYSIKEF